MNTTPDGREGDRIVRDGLRPVIDFIDRHREQPFFLWFAPKLPHVPHDPPPAQMRRYAKSDLPFDERTYYAEISWFDEGLGELLDHLERTGLRERTVVVYLADNGWVEVSDAPLGTRGEPRPDRNVRWFGGPRGKLSLYDPGFRTPIVFSWPGHIAAGRRVPNLVSIADVYPTLLGFAGLEASGDRPGIDLGPVLEQRAEPASETVIGHMMMIRSDTPLGERAAAARLVPGGFFARSERWHYLAYAHRDPELYDLASDPDERHNVAARYPDEVSALRAQIEGWTRTLELEPSALIGDQGLE
jgi:arylsulfatase A-like enzyme